MWQYYFMTERIDRELTLPSGLYAQIGKGVLAGVGMGLTDLVNQRPETAYRIIVDHALETARVADALLGESVAALTEGESREGGTLERETRQKFFDDAAGKSVNMSVYIIPRPTPGDLIMKQPPKKVQMLSFVATL
jgi:hypothetical protein